MVMDLLGHSQNSLTDGEHALTSCGRCSVRESGTWLSCSGRHSLTSSSEEVLDQIPTWEACRETSVQVGCRRWRAPTIVDGRQTGRLK